jgi:hypothetical protein
MMPDAVSRVNRQVERTIYISSIMCDSDRNTHLELRFQLQRMADKYGIRNAVAELMPRTGDGRRFVIREFR